MKEIKGYTSKDLADSDWASSATNRNNFRFLLQLGVWHDFLVKKEATECSTEYS